MDQAQANVEVAIKNNLPDPNLDDGGGPKRPLTGIEKIVVGSVVGTGVVQELSNPDPSKDAHQAHLDAAKENQQLKNQGEEPKPGLIDKFIKWLNN